MRDRIQPEFRICAQAFLLNPVDRFASLDVEMAKIDRRRDDTEAVMAWELSREPDVQ